MGTLRRFGLLVVGVVGVFVLVAAADQPVAVSPGTGNGTVIAGACPTFSWGAVAGAASYDLVAYQVREGAAPGGEPGDLKELWRVSLPGNVHSWTPPLDQCFAHGGNYAWAVRAEVGGEASAWSAANLFTVDKAPSAEEVRGMIGELRTYLKRRREAGGPGASSRTPGSEARGATKEPPAARSSGAAPGRASDLVKDGAMPGSMVEPLPLSLLGDGLTSIAAGSATPALGTPSLAIDGNLSLGSASNVFKNGSVFLWDDGSNTALGRGALASNTSGSGNTAVGSAALNANAGSNLLAGSDNSALGYHALKSNSSGSFNTAIGFRAMEANTSGQGNTGVGHGALTHNTTGSRNTAVGLDALVDNTTGGNNTAIGYLTLKNAVAGAANTALGSGALTADTSGTGAQGSYNTALGYRTLYSNTTGYDNVAVGNQALRSNTGGSGDQGSFNAALGDEALFSNTSGCCNTAMGHKALFANTTGTRNAGIGVNALHYNTSGSYNTALGYRALINNVASSHNTAIGGQALTAGHLLGGPGSDNTALGFQALASTRGSGNIGIGSGAGTLPPFETTGDNNIYIASQPAALDESGTIRIGGSSQTRTFIAGIRGVTTDVFNAINVVVDSNGQLGTVSSSRRFKQDIEDMGDVTDKLYELRPVTFRYKQYVKAAAEQGKDAKTVPRSYGLIAEEVAKVFPDLVVYGRDGRPETIKYRLLAPMLLNELQKEHRRAESDERELRSQGAELAREKAEVSLLLREQGAQNAELARVERVIGLDSARATTTRTAAPPLPGAKGKRPATAARRR